jgi:hypothetical protein
MTTRQWVDQGDRTTLALCSCGWRELRTTRSDAWAAAHTHTQIAHPGETEYTAHRKGYHNGQA